jgi:hypothetical protein
MISKTASYIDKSPLQRLSPHNNERGLLPVGADDLDLRQGNRTNSDALNVGSTSINDPAGSAAGRIKTP